MKNRKLNTSDVNLTNYVINHHNRDLLLSRSIHGRIAECAKSMLRGNQYQKEKVLSKLN